MIDKNIQQKFKNSFIFPYLERLKDSEYLVIYDKDEHIVSRFCKIGDKIYEIFNIFRIKDISDYANKNNMPVYSFLNVEKNDSFRCIICDRKVYVRLYKDYLKKDIEYITSIKANNTYTLIKTEVEKYGGKIVSFGINNNGLLVGASATDEDIYWIYVDKDFKVCFSSAVGGFKIIETPDDAFKKLLYTAQNEPENIVQLINDRVDDSIDYIFTDLKIR